MAEFAESPGEHTQGTPDEIALEVGDDPDAKVAALQVVTETLRP